MAMSSRITDSQTQKSLRLTPRGALLSAELLRLVGPDWGPGSTIDTNFWTVTNTGASSGVSLSGGIVTLTSGTANSGNGNFTSVRKARYVTTLTNYYHGCITLTATGGANTSRFWGPFTFATAPAVQDGYYFNYDGSTSTLSVNAVNAAGAPTTVSSGSFNGEVTSYTVDTNVHVYDILYNMSAVYFFIDNVLIHTMKPTTVPLVSTMTLMCSASSKNSASGTVSASMAVWENSILRCGQTEPRNKAFLISTNTTAILKRGAGTLQRAVLTSAGSSTNVFNLYDGLDNTGTLMVSVTGLPTAGLFTIELDIDFFTGLFVSQATGTPSNWTIVYD